LNQHLTFYGLLNNLKHVNPVACENPIDESQLVKITKSLMQQKFDKILKPIVFNKKRKIIFAHNSPLSKDEKLHIVRSEMGKHKSDLSKEKIYSIIESWDFGKLGKITQPAIVANNKIARKTVQKYWSEFKEYVKEQNLINTNMKLIPKKNYLQDTVMAQPSVSGIKPKDEAKSIIEDNIPAIELIARDRTKFTLINGEMYSDVVIAELEKKSFHNMNSIWVCDENKDRLWFTNNGYKLEFLTKFSY